MDNLNLVLCLEIQKALCQCLDDATSQGKDWRKFAEVVEISQYSTHLANQTVTLEAILRLRESQNNIKDYQSVFLKLAQINQLDSVVILELELKN